jgi:hypothetical protein
MAVSGPYYLNSPSLGTATAVFDDAALTTFALDGFYSDGLISREQVSGVLLPQQTCPSCLIPCGEEITQSGTEGIYLLNSQAGANLGAIIIRFDPYDVPDGIRATFNSVVYNKLTSPIDGIHESTVSGNFTYIGEIASDCGISGTTYPALPEYLYDGAVFILTGNTQAITVNAGDVSLSSVAPGNTMMVIPKLTASPSVVNIEIVGPCLSTDWNIIVECPVLLVGFNSSVMAVSAVAACTLYETVTYYNASLAGTSGTVGIYDFVYSDAYGSTPLAAGFYLATGSIVGGDDWFEVDSNGVVIDSGICAIPPPVSYNCVLGVCTDPGDGTGTYATLGACQAVCGPAVYSYSVRLTNVLGTICTDPIATVWSTSVILTVGDTIYYDSALTTLVTGFNYVVDDAGPPDIYNLDPATGIIGADTTLNCP